MGAKTGMNNDTLRSQNRGLVLKLLATETQLSRVELAKRTGLSKMSVSNIISEFLESGIVEECSTMAVQGSGRNPIALRLSSRAPKLVGLFVFREECVAVLCDLHLEILREARVVMNAEKAACLEETLYGLIDQVLSPAGETVLGIGIGSIGPLDLKRGLLLTPPHFFGIHDFPIVSLLQQRYHLPVYLDGQYDCAALAEKYFGVARSYQDFLFVGISSGIGSGIISGGEILRTDAGYTSELGHTSIDWHGNLCTCGNRGCLETYAGVQAVEPRLRDASGLDLSFREFCRLAETGENEAVCRIFDEMVQALGSALTSAVNLLDPQAILIGHQGHYLPDRCLSSLEDIIGLRRLARRRQRVPILRSAFGPQAQVKGSACCLLSHVFAGEFFL